MGNRTAVVYGIIFVVIALLVLLIVLNGGVLPI